MYMVPAPPPSNCFLHSMVYFARNLLFSIMAAEGEVVKRKLQELRVIDLKAELEKRGLEKAGVKAMLLERMQQALQKEGHDPDEYLFEVINEVTPIKKPSKRTNKKLARDDESETHSNVDESQNDLVLDDDEKMDSDDDRIDEKFFQVLEATDGGEDAIDLSIEEGEKLLIDEDFAGSGEKEEQVANGMMNSIATIIEALDVSADEGVGFLSRDSFCIVEVNNEKNKKKNDGEESQKSEPAPSEVAASGENAQKSNGTDEQDDATGVKGDDHGSLVVHVEDAQRDLDSEMASSAPASGEGEALTNGDQAGKDSKTESSGVKKSSEEVPKKTDGKAASNDKAPAISKGDEGETSDKNKTPASDKSENKSPAKGGKQEEEKPAIPASNKAKSTAANTKDGKSAVDRSKIIRPAISAKNLWVTGLSSTTRATDLKALFSKHGKVIGAKIVSNARSSVSRCYGFVTMATIEEASKCIQYLHRTELHGRMISVERAKAEPVGPSRRKDVKPVATVKKVPEKKETGAQAKAVEAGEKKPDESDKKEKAKEEVKVQEKETTAEKKEDSETKVTNSEKVQEKPAESTQEDKSAKKENDKGKRDNSRKGSTSKERSSHERHIHHPRLPVSGFRPGFRRRPFFRRPTMYRSLHNTLTFNHIRAERIRQRQREEEREMRESERRRRQDIVRQREIERKQREESIRLERERERLRIERERLERERAEVMRLEREKQRMERERIERERDELRRRERLRVDDHRRPFKRPFDNFRNSRETDFDDRKRPFIPNTSRRVDTFERKNDRFGDSTRRDMGSRDSSLHERSGRFERGPLPRDTDLRGHSRDDRSMSFRDGSDSISQSRPTPKDDWKGSRGHHSVTRGDRFDSGKGVSGSMNYVSDRGGDSWHGGVSQSDSRGSGSKPYSSGGGMQSRDSWGSDRKSEGQSWGRSDSQGDRWGSNVSSSGRGQQSMGMNPSLLPQPSGMFDSSSSSTGMVGMGMSGSSYGSDRFDAYKSMSSMRRF